MTDSNDIITELYKSLHKLKTRRFPFFFKNECKYNATLKVINVYNDTFDTYGNKDMNLFKLMLNKLIEQNYKLQIQCSYKIELYSCIETISFIKDERKKYESRLSFLLEEQEVFHYWLNKL